MSKRYKQARHARGNKMAKKPRARCCDARSSGEYRVSPGGCHLAFIMLANVKTPTDAKCQRDCGVPGALAHWASINEHNR